MVLSNHNPDAAIFVPTKLEAAIRSVQPYFKELNSLDKAALAQFSLIWTIFESRIAEKLSLEGRSVNAKQICIYSDHQDVNCLPQNQTNQAVEFWHQRYIDAGQPNASFGSLNFKDWDKKELVIATLKCTEHSPENRKAALIIIYRIRCNLFHGTKWEYGMQDQRENFQHGVNVMLEALGADAGLLPV
ncbi:hypothetical protein ACOTTU_20520 [Roseobacter sp. EG26]|uniref:hypothetical protein n=1 Tax=Roseobacter sp. EG26 TaxID=3412477 RepID=UPI003CE58695